MKDGGGADDLPPVAGEVSGRPSISLSLLALIADPIRLAIVRELSENRSLSLADIAARADVHPNTIRGHIADFEAAGVIEREHASQEGPGRPQLYYRLSAGWRMPGSDMLGLSELLAALTIRLAPTGQDIQELGRQWGTFLRGRPGGNTVAALPHLLERLGFDAEVRGSEIRLRSCPCPLVSPQRPELICALAGAAIDGIIDGDPRRLRVCATDHDPVRRTCTIHLREPPALPKAAS